MNECSSQSRETLEILLFEVLKGLERLRETQTPLLPGSAGVNGFHQCCKNIISLLNEMHDEIVELKRFMQHLAEENDRLEKRVSLLYFASRKLLADKETLDSAKV